MVRQTLDGGVARAWGRGQSSRHMLMTMFGGCRRYTHGSSVVVPHHSGVSLMSRSRVERVRVTVPIRKVLGLNVQS